MRRWSGVPTGARPVPEPPAAVAAPDLRAAQVRQLFENAPLGFAATAINAAALGIVLRPVLPFRTLLAWGAVLAAVTIARIVQARRYRRAEPAVADAPRWERRFVVGMAASGAVWGTAGALLVPAGDLAHEVFVAFVIGGMVAGAGGTFSIRRSAFFAFAVPALAPLTALLLGSDDPIRVTMGGMILLFGLIISITALRTHRTATGALCLAFENRDLVADLSRANEDTERLNADLRHEVGERRRAEESLRRHQEELESLVAARTGQLEETNRQLRESEAKLRAIFDNTGDPIFIHDQQGRILDYNEAAARAYGFARGGFLPGTIAELETPDQARRIPERAAALERDGRAVFESEHRRADGSTVPVEVSAVLVEIADWALVISVCRDITARKRAEEVIRRLNTDLEARVRERTADLEQTVQDLEAFSYSVSHDLRAPLRAISGYATILGQEEARLSGEGRAMLGRIRRAAVRLGTLIDSILAFSRAGRAARSNEEVDLAALARTVAEDLGQTYPETAIRVESLPVVRGDPAMLGQVFENLIGNACKFSARRERPEVVVGSFPDQGGSVVFVRDNGVGFDPRHADGLFGMFQRIHDEKDFPGTGVGLAIVKRLVARHGGEIWAEAVPGGGATFLFSIPLPGAPAEAVRAST